MNFELMKAGFPPIDIKFTDRIAYYNAFDEYHVKHNLSAMENLFAGCACCTVGSELIQSISYIEEKFAPDWLILETTGLAYPGLIRDNLRAACQKTCRICTVVDAQRFHRILKPMEALLQGQISCADVVLINKTDLADEQTIQSCERIVRQMNESAIRLRACAADDRQDAVWAAVLGGEV